MIRVRAGDLRRMCVNGLNSPPIAQVSVPRATERPVAADAALFAEGHAQSCISAERPGEIGPSCRVRERLIHNPFGGRQRRWGLWTIESPGAELHNAGVQG